MDIIHYNLSNTGRALVLSRLEFLVVVASMSVGGKNEKYKLLSAPPFNRLEGVNYYSFLNEFERVNAELYNFLLEGRFSSMIAEIGDESVVLDYPDALTTDVILSSLACSMSGRTEDLARLMNTFTRRPHSTTRKTKYTAAMRDVSHDLVVYVLEHLIKDLFTAVNYQPNQGE